MNYPFFKTKAEYINSLVELQNKIKELLENSAEYDFSEKIISENKYPISSFLSLKNSLIESETYTCKDNHYSTSENVLKPHPVTDSKENKKSKDINIKPAEQKEVISNSKQCSIKGSATCGDQKEKVTAKKVIEKDVQQNSNQIVYTDVKLENIIDFNCFSNEEDVEKELMSKIKVEVKNNEKDEKDEKIKTDKSYIKKIEDYQEQCRKKKIEIEEKKIKEKKERLEISKLKKGLFTKTKILTKPTKSYIKQGKVSNYISFFRLPFFRTYELHDYKSSFRPTVFFGCYCDDDLNAIIRNKSVKIIVWAGSDSDYFRRDFAKRALSVLKQMPRTYHIAISNYIENDLKAFKIPYRRISFCLNDISHYAPVRKGKSIYFYTSINNCELYGCNIFKKVFAMLRTKYNFIIAVCQKQLKYINPKNPVIKKYPFLKSARYYKNIRSVYAQCFIGLRLTYHDGNANTVQELGLCGIRCLYNGDFQLKNTIRYRNVRDIIRSINQEAKTIGTLNPELSQQVKTYLQPNFSWLDIKNYIR